MPKKIIYRRKKGFGVPIGKWFYQQQLPFTNPHSLLLNSDFINRKLAEHIQQQADQRAFLWNLWVYQAMS